MSRFMSQMLEKLFITESTSSKAPDPEYPTLQFPPPPPLGTGTRSLCARCLTLLSHVITTHGNGSGHPSITMRHSLLASDPSEVDCAQGNTASLQRQYCVICVKTLDLFEAARAHVSFEQTLRKSPRSEWDISWSVDALDSEEKPHISRPEESVFVQITTDHKRGYGWGMGEPDKMLDIPAERNIKANTIAGSFSIHPDWGTDEDGKPKVNLGDHAVIQPLDADEAHFSSTLSPGSVALWLGNKPTSPWLPDRLVHITRTESSEPIDSSPKQSTITARIVEKSDLSDFPPDTKPSASMYISLSHCWGPAPDPSAPLGGRASTVLTTTNLSAWKQSLPLDHLPATFQHALTVSATLGFSYLWIDSLCILQDSVADWREQSAVMGDVYKHAWLNIAALSSTTDTTGFLNHARDPRRIFGFRAPFATLLGRSPSDTDPECILLRGSAKLLWTYSRDLPGLTTVNAPLFERAWVFQERSLARRSLGFAANSVYWVCDEMAQSEHPEWAGAGMAAEALRFTQHHVVDTRPALVLAAQNGELATARATAWELLEAFDMRWHGTVTSYTLCKLTRHTDKLVAVSSVARALADTRVLSARYLAGLWDVNLPFQLLWNTSEGRTAPPRKKVGDLEYVAPSWSWASVEAPVQPRFVYQDSLLALADVAASDVVLQSEFLFGSLEAGWLRLRGRLNRVKRVGTKMHGSDKSVYLTDRATGESLWFWGDTRDGYALIESGRNLDKLVWMPMTLRFDSRMLECKCLVMAEVPPDEEIGREHGFVREGEKVYRRLGTGDFGRIPSMLQIDKLLLTLGAYPDIEAKDGEGSHLKNGFKRREDDMEEFVLI